MGSKQTQGHRCSVCTGSYHHPDVRCHDSLLVHTFLTQAPEPPRVICSLPRDISFQQEPWQVSSLSVSSWLPHPSPSPWPVFSKNSVIILAKNLLLQCFILAISHPLTPILLLGYKFPHAPAVFGTEPSFLYRRLFP